MCMVNLLRLSLENGAGGVVLRIIVFSDSHKDIDSCARVIRNMVGVDMVLHAGDHASDAAELEKMFPEIEFKYVAGNCDFTAVPSELIIEAEGKRIFLTHGHGYAVKYDSDYYTISQKGAAVGADCVVFGHTHVPVCDFSKNPPILNPGSIKHGGTFGVIEIEDGKLKACTCNA